MTYFKKILSIIFRPFHTYDLLQQCEDLTTKQAATIKDQRRVLAAGHDWRVDINRDLDRAVAGMRECLKLHGYQANPDIITHDDAYNTFEVEIKPLPSAKNTGAQRTPFAARGRSLVAAYAAALTVLNAHRTIQDTDDTTEKESAADTDTDDGSISERQPQKD